MMMEYNNGRQNDDHFCNKSSQMSVQAPPAPIKKSQKVSLGDRLSDLSVLSSTLQSGMTKAASEVI